MADPGLSSSRWNIGRPAYYWASDNLKKPNTSTASASSLTTATTVNTASTPASDRTAITTPSSNGSPFSIHVPALNRIPAPWDELTRYAKIVRRMQWKLPFLEQGYAKATDYKSSSEEGRAEAELMFKLDFFEYYMLLERALVHLLGVFGIQITGGFGARTNGNGNGNGNGHWRGHQKPWEQSDHQFHANVLEALDDPGNPLHEVLGKTNARYALARAKELRNRWKNADDPDAALAAKLRNGGQAARPLVEYNLGWIVEKISAGFQDGYWTAEQYVAELRALAAVHGMPRDVYMGSGHTEEAQWEFITDAMDWEAI